MANDAVRIDIEWGRIESELVANVDKAQHVLDAQVLKDTTPYVPMDTGNLANSGVRATNIGSGSVTWDAPYAARQYYDAPNKANDVHPLATTFWFEAAKAACKATWLRVAKRAGGSR